MSSQTKMLSGVSPHFASLVAECERLRLQGQAEEALRLLGAAWDEATLSTSSNAEHIALLLARAETLSELSRVDEAITVYQATRSADSASLPARFGLSFALYLAERWQDALAELDALLEIAPAYPNAAWLRAGLLRRLHGDQDPCVLDAYRQVLAVDPRNLYAQVERADVLRALGRYEEARDVYAHCQSPKTCDDEALRVEAAFKRGCVAMVLNETADARAAFQVVLDAAPDYPDAREMLALASGDSA